LFGPVVGEIQKISEVDFLLIVTRRATLFSCSLAVARQMRATEVCVYTRIMIALQGLV